MGESEGKGGYMGKIIDRRVYEGKVFRMYLERLGEMGYNSDDPKTKEWGLLKPNGRFEVALPHSCDQWSIAYGKPEECIKDLESFISEAKDILKILKKEE